MHSLHRTNKLGIIYGRTCYKGCLNYFDYTRTNQEKNGHKRTYNSTFSLWTCPVILLQEFIADFDYTISDSLSNQVRVYVLPWSWKKASLPVSLGHLGLAVLVCVLLPLLLPLLFLPRTLWVLCRVFLPLLPLFLFILTPIWRPWPSLMVTMNGGLWRTLVPSVSVVSL